MCALMVTLRGELGPHRKPKLLRVIHSGTAKKGNRKSAKQMICTLIVVQTADAIEVRKVQDGTSNTKKFPLDGGEGIYHTDNHIPGKCKGQLKGKRLVLDSVIVTRPLAGGPAGGSTSHQRTVGLIAGFENAGHPRRGRQSTASYGQYRRPLD